MIDRHSPIVSLELADARIGAALVDPAVRNDVKAFLQLAVGRDPVDAAADAQLLVQLLGDRADAFLREALASAGR